MLPRRAPLLGYALACAAVALAVMLRMAAGPVLGDRSPYLFQFPAVLVTAWFGGRWPAFVSVALGALATHFIEPAPRSLDPDIAYWLAFVVFLGISTAVIELTMATRRAEQRGQRAVERLDLALATGRMGVFEWDLARDEVWWSASLKSVYGLPPEAFGRTFEAFRQLVHEDDRRKVEAALEHATKTGDDFRVEFRFLRPDGMVRWIDASGKVFTDVAGTPARVVGTSRDITEHHEAAGALREMQGRFQALVAHAPLVVYAKDREGRYVMVNGRWTEITGISEGDALGKTDADLFAPSLAALTTEHDREVLETGHPVQFEHTFSSLGRTHALLMIKFPLSDDEGHPIAVCGIASDINARKQAEAVLKDADRRKDEFLAILAHELRNPLAPVRLALEMLRSNEGNRVVATRAMDVMERQLAHLVRLIDDLLDVSRITRGKLELRRGRVQLTDVIRTALETSRPQIDAAGHALEVELPDEPIELHADLTRLAQVISNLLNNAAKYTPRGGKITVRATASDDEVEITVCDTGIGLAPEHLSRVFEMFAQVGPLTTRGHGGLGIGLALARALVDMHGGRIEAASDGLDKGSLFTVHLPRANASDARTSMPDIEIHAAPGLRVLVADDNRDAIDTLALFLEQSGHEVRIANDGIEALEAAESFLPDVCVLDIGMPRMDGYQVARTLRERGHTPMLIALTGWGQAEDHRRSREAGFDYHLIKPVQPRTLVKLLATAPRASDAPSAPAPARSAGTG